MLLLLKFYKKVFYCDYKKEDFDVLKSKEFFKKMMWNSWSMFNYLNGVGFYRILKLII